MPFTLSHTAVVLPFINSARLSATGLLIGSMIPDFEYFLRLRVYGIYGHTFWGMFWFDLPLALLMAYAFHYWVRPAVLPNLPVFLQRQWSISEGFQWNEYVRSHIIVVVLSILAGTATHIFWDTFTHNNTWMVKNVAFLRMQVDLGFQDYPMWHILQQVSTGIGLIVLIWFISRVPPNVEIKKPDPIYWISVTVIAGSIITWRLFAIAQEEILKLGHVAVVGMGAGMYSLIIVSFLWTITKRKVDL